jgi:DNA-binding MarR family transcriptional regulator
MRSTGRRGHAGLKLSHGQILPLVGPSGVRLRELAELHGVSRQAISAIAQDLEALGYVHRAPDARDRRGVVVRLTGRGMRLIADSVEALDDLERGWSARLAPDALRGFADVARSLYLAQGLEAEILFDAFGRAAPPAADRAGEAPIPAARARAASDAGAPREAQPEAREDLARLAARLRDRLGDRDAARLAAHLVAQPATRARRPTRPGGAPT